MNLPQQRPFVMEEDPASFMDTDLDTEEMLMDVMGGPEQAQTKLVHTDFFNGMILTIHSLLTAWLILTSTDKILKTILMMTTWIRSDV